MLRRLFAVAPLCIAALSVQACSVDLTQDSPGDAGRLRFRYAGEDCLLGCPVDREVLAGAAMDVTVSILDPDVRYSARTTTSSIATATSRQSCDCATHIAGETRSRPVQPEDKCAAGEEKSCTLFVTLETKGAGDVKLEVLDGARVYVDSMTAKVREPARLVSTVRSDNQEVARGADGVYSIKLDAAVQIETKVFSASDQDLLFTGHGVDVKFADERVIGPLDFEIFGSSDTAVGKAKALGDARVTIRAGTRTEALAFRVVR